MNCSSAKRTQHTVLYASLLIALVSTTAHAAEPAAASPEQPQTTQTDPVALDSVLVTATKRGSSSIQKTPITMQSFSADDMKVKGIVDMEGLYRQVPGLSIQDEGPGDKRYIIRGLNATGAGTTGVYLDDVVITGENSQDGSGQQVDVKLFDMDRIEVLKGPQGTTFGSSSMAGTVRYITAKPDLSEFGGNFQTSMRSTQGAELGNQTDVAVNLPIVKDKFAIRVAGYYQDQPGWIDNQFEKGANNEESKAARISAKWAITDDLTWNGMAMKQKIHQDSKSYYNTYDYYGNQITSGDNYRQADVARAPWDEDDHFYSTGLEFRQDYGTFTLTASRFDRDSTFTRDATLAAASYFALDLDDAAKSILTQPKTRRVDSYEGRFASTWSGPLQLLTGVFYQKEKRDYESLWVSTDAQGYVEADPFVILDRTVSTQVEEKAAYAELTYSLTDALRVTAAGRYYDFALDEDAVSIVSAGGGAGSGALPHVSYKDDGVISRFNMSYDLSKDVMVYGQAAQGFRAGGTNDQTAVELANAPIPAGYGSDSLWSYELGMKSSWFDHKLVANAALYYTDWSDIQVKAQATVVGSNGSSVTYPYTANGGKAKVRGVEFELRARPVTGLNMGVSVNYSDARLTQDNPAPSIGDAGDAMPYVPLWSASANIDYAFQLPVAGLSASVGADYSFTGTRNTDYNATASTYHQLPSYSLVNLHAGVFRDSWSLDLIVNNVFNDDSVINYNDIVPEYYPEGYYFNRPRTVILSFSTKF